MTNNDELALKLSEEELKHRATWPKGTFDRDAALELIDARQHILALLAERDADKKLIAEQDARLIEYAQIAAGYAHRIAELEARTVSVKLPKLYGMDFCDALVPDEKNGFLFYSEQVIAALAAAGINLEVGE